MPYGILFFALSGIGLWLIKFFYLFAKGVDNVVYMCYTIYRNLRKWGKNKMKMLTVVFNDDNEYEKLKNDAYEHKMNISQFIRYLVAKEREEREKWEYI